VTQFSFWQNRRKRTDALVAAIFLWAPASMIVGALIDTPDARIAGSVIAGAPLAIGAIWFLAALVREATPFQRAMIVIFLAAIIALGAALPGQFAPPEY